jgi:transcriptional regulator with XRE-family HTH domain
VSEEVTREDLERNLRRRLLSARIARKWSRDKLMDEARISTAALGRLERGILPSLPLLVRLASTLGVSTDWLLTGQASLMTETDARSIEDKSGIIVPDPTGAIG